MANIFCISDTHFGHAATFEKFKQPDGRPMRPFTSLEEMDEHMITAWNAVVKPQDKVYHFGDVAMRKEHIATVGRCNGHKRLILGNHDEKDVRLYLPFFEGIYSTRQIDHMVFSHIPLHPESIGPSLLGNVHGHVHNNVPQGHFGPRHFNISVEMINYTPMAIEDVKNALRAQQADDERLKVLTIMQVG